MSGHALNEAKPVTDWVTGTLTLHFAGASVKHRMSLAEARAVQQILDDKRASDALDWHCVSWIQFDSAKVLDAEFAIDEDLGWPVNSEERATLAKHGYVGGILRTLIEVGKAQQREPSYSLLALQVLFEAALAGTKGDRFTALAEKLEGDVGADCLRSLLDQVDLKAQRSPSRAPEKDEPDETVSAQERVVDLSEEGARDDEAVGDFPESAGLSTDPDLDTESPGGESRESGNPDSGRDDE